MKKQPSSTDREDIEMISRKAGWLYEQGEHEKAFQEYLSLAEQGYASSQRFVGWLFFRGDGVKANNEKAIYWLQKAAVSGDVEAMFGVGRVHMAQRCFVDARDWYERSANAGFLPGMYWLARFHRDGIVLTQDESTAFELFCRAADLGHLQSQREQSIMLLRGQFGFLGRLKGSCIFARLIVRSLRQWFRDPLDQKAMI